MSAKVTLVKSTQISLLRKFKILEVKRQLWYVANKGCCERHLTQLQEIRVAAQDNTLTKPGFHMIRSLPVKGKNREIRVLQMEETWKKD